MSIMNNHDISISLRRELPSSIRPQWFNMVNQRNTVVSLTNFHQPFPNSTKGTAMLSMSTLWSSFW